MLRHSKQLINVTTIAHATEERCFLCGPCRWYITRTSYDNMLQVQLDKENPGTGNIRGLNLAAVNPTTVQVSNCRFLGLNKLRHSLMHYPALTDVPVYSRT
jgi:hypothetical protein